jgi:hypothetical protein
MCKGHRQKIKPMGDQTKKTLTWKSHSQGLEDACETWQDEPQQEAEHLEGSSNKPMGGRNEEMHSYAFAVIYL